MDLSACSFTGLNARGLSYHVRTDSSGVLYCTIFLTAQKHPNSFVTYSIAPSSCAVRMRSGLVLVLAVGLYGAEMDEYRLRSILYRLGSIEYRLKSIFYRLKSIFYRLKSILYRLTSILYRLKSILYRLKSILDRLKSIFYRLESILYRLQPILHRLKAILS